MRLLESPGSVSRPSGATDGPVSVALVAVLRRRTAPADHRRVEACRRDHPDVSGIADEHTSHLSLKRKPGFSNFYGMNWETPSVARSPTWSVPDHLRILDWGRLADGVPRGANRSGRHPAAAKRRTVHSSSLSTRSDEKPSCPELGNHRVIKFGSRRWPAETTISGNRAQRPPIPRRP